MFANPIVLVLLGILVGLMFGDTIRSLPGVRSLPI